MEKKLEETLNINKKEKPKKKVEEPMVDGVFKNWETRGAPLAFSFTADKSPAKKYTLEDGKRYKIPISVARHINSCTYPINESEVDKQGNYLGTRESIVRRFSFRRVDDLIDNID